MNRLQRLHAAGQSIWLDFIDRNLLGSGTLQRRIEEDALTGMTSNPTIFEKALAEGSAYDADLRAAPEGASAWELFELLAASDVRAACDIFRPVYDSTNGGDGYVSLEVSPGAANDAEETVVEAHRLWKAVDRPNLMIKVPGTDAGAAAARRLIADGINVNVTLLFAVEAHAKVIDAYIAGLEDRAAAGKPLDHVGGVASFFISRVDSEIDKRLDAMIASAQSPEDAERLKGLKGKAAIANAKLAYKLFQSRFSGQRWERLVEKGARVQRPLWASTSTKNPAYRDVLYVEELIGPDTVNTMPPQTLEAFRDHGETRRSVDENVGGAVQLLAELESIGISMKDVTDQLLREGLASFSKSFDTLVAGLEAKSRELGRSFAAR
ncbi:MAG TPA: transaldolase [Gemmatimonadaceae bacterium]|nr:transaldolase [Gemmatimonadaceae bacterium]